MALGLPSNSSIASSTVNTIVLGVLSKSVAGASDVTLSESEANNMIHEYTGALTGNISVIVPDDTKLYVVNNQTTGAFTLTVKTSAGTGFAFGTTDKGVAIVYSDGTDVVQATAFL